MTEHSGDGGGHHPTDIPVRPAPGQPYGQIALGGIEQERQQASNRPGIARHIRRAYIAASNLSDVAAARLYDLLAVRSRVLRDQLGPKLGFIDIGRQPEERPIRYSRRFLHEGKSFELPVFRA